MYRRRQRESYGYFMGTHSSPSLSLHTSLQKVFSCNQRSPEDTHEGRGS